MEVAVTGASGHIGGVLVRALIEENRQVRALMHKSMGGLPGLKADFVEADIRNLDSLYKAFSNADTVYHLAARISISSGDREEVESINIGGTRNVVEACLKCGVKRLVHFSSIHAMIQKPFDIGVDENRSLADSDSCPVYDRTKAAGEKEVRRGIEKGLDAVIVNPTAVIGPWDYQPSFLGDVLISLAQHKLPALIEGGFDWVDVRDVVQGAITAEKLGRRGEKYLLSGHWATVCDLATLSSEITGVRAPSLVCPIWLARTTAPLVTLYNQVMHRRQLYTAASIRALSTCNKVISHEKARQELDYHPRPLQETLADTYIWFQEAGKLHRSLKIKR